MENKKNRYKYKRSSLQFPDTFIKHLEKIVPTGTHKNKFVMEKLGFKMEEKTND